MSHIWLTIQQTQLPNNIIISQLLCFGITVLSRLQLKHDYKKPNMVPITRCLIKKVKVKIIYLTLRTVGSGARDSYFEASCVKYIIMEMEFLSVIF